MQAVLTDADLPDSHDDETTGTPSTLAQLAAEQGSDIQRAAGAARLGRLARRRTDHAAALHELIGILVGPHDQKPQVRPHRCSPNDLETPSHLTAGQTGWLRQLADVVQAAPTRRERNAVWSSIATPLGITAQILRRWRELDDTKTATFSAALDRRGEEKLPT